MQQKAASELGMAIPEAKKTVMVVLEGAAPVAEAKK